MGNLALEKEKGSCSTDVRRRGGKDGCRHDMCGCEKKKARESHLLASVFSVKQEVRFCWKQDSRTVVKAGMKYLLRKREREPTSDT